MRKESQRQLVEEGFGDIVRGAASAFMQSKLGQAIKQDLQPFTDIKKAFDRQSPKATLQYELKNSFYRTFDYRSIQLGKEQKLSGDEKHDNRVSIPFTAKRMKGISGNTTTGGLSGGKEGQEQFTAILSRNRKGVSGINSDVGVYQLEVVRDATGKKIEPDTRSTRDTTSRVSQKVWDAIKAEVAKGNLDRATILTSLAKYTPKSYDELEKNNNLKVEINKDIAARNSKLPATLAYYKSNNLADNTIVESFYVTQLQLLESSYNLRYELPINKGN